MERTKHSRIQLYIIFVIRLGCPVTERSREMSEQVCLSAINDNRIAIVLLQILRKKEIINQSTFEKTYRKYKEKLKEAA